MNGDNSNKRILEEPYKRFLFPDLEFFRSQDAHNKIPEKISVFPFYLFNKDLSFLF